MCLHFCLNQHFLVHLTCYVNNTLFDRIIQISVHEEFEGLFQAWFSIFFILYLNGPYEERCEWNLMYLWHLVRVVFFLVLDDTFLFFFTIMYLQIWPLWMGVGMLLVTMTLLLRCSWTRWGWREWGAWGASLAEPTVGSNIFEYELFGSNSNFPKDP